MPCAAYAFMPYYIIYGDSCEWIELKAREAQCCHYYVNTLTITKHVLMMIITSQTPRKRYNYLTT